MADPGEPPEIISPSPRRRNQLTVARAMGLVALVAVSLLSGDTLVYLTFALALAISGILAVRWAVPWPEVLVPRRYRKPAWVLWWVVLLICPIAIVELNRLYGGRGNPLPFNTPRPWAADAVVSLTSVHMLGCSVVAAIVVAALTRGERALLAWIVIVGIGIFTFLMCLGAEMSITGNWL